jgi:Protein of unknown function (DUF2934)
MSKTKTLQARPKSPRNTGVQALVEYASSTELPDEAARQAMISDAAYYRAQQRGFEPGHELDDWLAAEAEIVGSSPLPALRPAAH